MLEHCADVWIVESHFEGGGSDNHVTGTANASVLRCCAVDHHEAGQSAQILGGIPELADIVSGAVVGTRGTKDCQASLWLTVHSPWLPAFGILKLGVEPVDYIEIVREGKQTAPEHPRRSVYRARDRACDASASPSE